MFEVAADAYIRFMGRFSGPLAVPFAALGLTGTPPSGRVLDVGCGPGMLTSELVRRQGADRVAAVDPVGTFVAAAREAHPDADIHQSRGEELPFADQSFDAVLSQLVVNFMPDPLAGVTEMRRVSRPGGRITVCVWDHGGGTGPLSPYWRAAQAIDPAAGGEAHAVGSTAGDLARLLADAGLQEVTEVPLTVEVAFSDFTTWWEPYTLAVGTAGSHFAGLDEEQQGRVVALLRAELGDGPFTLTARAWAASGVC